MNKVNIQNLIAVCDMAIQKGIIQPDDILPVGIARKAAIDMVAQLTNKAHRVVPESTDEQPNEAKAKQ